MAHRVARKRSRRHPPRSPEAWPPPPSLPAACALCGRAIGARIEWHHVVPRSEGGRETAPLHPICHRAIHAAVTNRELARFYPTLDALRGHERIARFLRWIAGKPPDFHAPTRSGDRHG